MAPDLAPGIAELAEHTALLWRMHEILNEGRRLITSNQYDAPAEHKTKIRSWKMNELRYYEVPSPFPTLARGMFTQWLPGHEGQAECEEGGYWRVIARGYDKFFNVGETSWTSWSSLETYTEAPYDVTIKSNGCIILVAALTPDKLLITSKHSIGPCKGFLVSHAQMGERWLDKHLSSAGKTQSDLAARLWKDNWTAVCELCDDLFEEHVLPVAPDQAGLHLHGINTSQPAFETQPPEFLETFAREWGLIPTPYLRLNSVSEVVEFTDECAKTGSWNGRAIEGFVVRTRVQRGQSQSQLNKDTHKNAPPYPQGSSMFFKVKFDEPYMMYREFREITRTLLTSIGNADPPRMPRSRLRRPETRVYKHWVKTEIDRDRKQFDGFMQCRGIIATRDRFLAWLNTAAGKEALAAEREQKGRVCEHRPTESEHTGRERERKGRGHEQKDREHEQKGRGRKQKGRATVAMKSDKHAIAISAPRPRSRWVIFPVAIPGCGKTSVAVALSHLFGFGHIQSDDVKARHQASVFLSAVAKLLDENDVVIADKNNHLFQHRLGLRNAIANVRPPVKLLALNWSTTNLPRNVVHRVCADRVAARGGNHQSLIPGDHGTHEDVLWRFLKDTNDLEEDEFDECIEMDVEEGLEEAMARAVDGIVRVLGLPEPLQEQIDVALRRARAYEAESKAEAPPAKEAPRYYALLPEADFRAPAERRARASDAPKELEELWESAIAQTDKKHALVAVRPHVTLVHEKGLAAPEEQALWDRCEALAPSTMFRLRFDTLVYNRRVLAAVVGDIGPSDGPAGDGAGAFVQELPQSVRKRLHVTIARRDVDVKPVEAKTLVEEWRENPANREVRAIALEEPLDVLARVRGFST